MFSSPKSRAVGFVLLVLALASGALLISSMYGLFGDSEPSSPLVGEWTLDKVDPPGLSGRPADVRAGVEDQIADWIQLNLTVFEDGRWSTAMRLQVPESEAESFAGVFAGAVPESWGLPGAGLRSAARGEVPESSIPDADGWLRESGTWEEFGGFYRFTTIQGDRQYIKLRDGRMAFSGGAFVLVRRSADQAPEVDRSPGSGIRNENE